MTFTYASDLSTPLAKVRSLLQDIDASRPLLQDEEINFHLTNNSSDVYSAAADAADVVASHFGRMISRSAIDVTDDPIQSAEFWRGQANAFRAKRNTNLTIFAGGLTRSGKRSIAEDADAVQPAFSIGMDDNDQGSEQTSRQGRYNEDGGS